MLKVDAITFFGSKTKLANAAGVRLASVAAWGIFEVDDDATPDEIHDGA